MLPRPKFNKFLKDIKASDSPVDCKENGKQTVKRYRLYIFARKKNFYKNDIQQPLHINFWLSEPIVRVSKIF